jgi:SAM-dependent methyltransferase
VIDCQPKDLTVSDQWLKDNLVCPRDYSSLTNVEGRLRCRFNHTYPIIDGVPVLLVREAEQVFAAATASLAQQSTGCDDPYHIDTLGIDDSEKAMLRRRLSTQTESVDPVASFLVGATNGIAYKRLVGTLRDYPIPSLRLPPGKGRVLLDIGCGWGRWSIAGALRGYATVGIDPSLGAVLAARRVAAKFGLAPRFVVADARFLPFRSGSIDAAFSYSVIQHFSRPDARQAVSEIGRVLRHGGEAFVQMPTVLGLRCLYHQARRRFRAARGFEVRYWTIPALRRLFAQAIGPAKVTIDCYFGIGLQPSDRHLMPLTARAAISASELLRRMGNIFPPLSWLADSVYISSTRKTA